MARHRRSSKLETRASRLRLDIKRKPYFLQVAPRVGLGYRRNQGPGTWIARGADGHGGYWTKAFAIADDHEDADGNTILNFWQAQDRAKQVVRGPVGGIRPITVAEALEHYASDLTVRGGSSANARRVINCVPPTLAAKTVSLLSSRELRHWRDGLINSGLKASSADRNARMLKAALNLAAKDDPRDVHRGSPAQLALADDERPDLASGHAKAAAGSLALALRILAAPRPDGAADPRAAP